MADREKVIKGLECCGDTMNCNECPYDSEMGGCFRNLKADALNLLKEQKKQIEWLEYSVSVAQNNLNFYINGND